VVREIVKVLCGCHWSRLFFTLTVANSHNVINTEMGINSMCPLCVLCSMRFSRVLKFPKIDPRYYHHHKHQQHQGEGHSNTKAKAIRQVADDGRAYKKS